MRDGAAVAAQAAAATPVKDRLNAVANTQHTDVHMQALLTRRAAELASQEAAQYGRGQRRVRGPPTSFEAVFYS